MDSVVYKVVPKAKRAKPQKCSACGASPNDRLAHGVPMRCWLEHPDAPLIPWPPELATAMHYVIEKSQHGIDLERWVEECDLTELTGVGRGDLAIALTYARLWKPHGWNESDLPVIPGKVTIFGKRRDR